MISPKEVIGLVKKLGIAHSTVVPSVCKNLPPFPDWSGNCVGIDIQAGEPELLVNTWPADPKASLEAKPFVEPIIISPIELIGFMNPGDSDFQYGLVPSVLNNFPSFPSCIGKSIPDGGGC